MEEERDGRSLGDYQRDARSKITFTMETVREGREGGRGERWKKTWRLPKRC
jgi:hypothetical protein